MIEKDPEECADAGAAFVVPIASAEKVQPVSAGAEPMHGKRSQKLMRTALIAAAVVAVMVIVTVSAAAAGINIWGWVPVWNDSTAQFVQAESVNALSLDIPLALRQVGVQEPMFPTWLPEGFMLEEQSIQLDEQTILYAVYVYKERIISIIIRNITNPNETGSLEINGSDPITYVKNGTTHYIFSNCDSLVTSWLVGQYMITISGDASIDEMERIIDSIYEVKP